MIKIYHVPKSRSLRVVWLMEELGEDYELIRVSFPPGEDFREVNAMGTVPAIDDDGIVMGESIAILQYLTGRRLQKSMELKITVGPSNPAAYAEHLQFLHLGEASLTMPLNVLFRTRRLGPAPDKANWTTGDCEQMFADRLRAVAERLSDGRTYVTGEDFTIADMSVGYALGFAEALGLDRLFTPEVKAYLARLRARPAYQRAAAK